MKKTLLLLFIVGIYFPAMSQHEADKWYFGTTAALDFSSGSPVVGTGALSTSEGCSAVSDATGKLKFYTNGVSVWDSTDAVMPNGSGLMGDISSTQSAVVVPSPIANSQYYIFTTAADGGSDGFRYSIVDMTLHGGLGDVMPTNKNILITDSTTEKIAAIKDIGANSYWIVMHKWGTNEFYAYHLTPAGLQPPVISNSGTVHNTSRIQNTYGQMKFNMCGDKLALAIGYQNTVEVFDFSSTTGVVSSPLTLIMPDHVYGVEFSRNSNLLYATCYDPSGTLLQYNISAGSMALILSSRTPLSGTADLYGLQIGPDGKIYLARSFGTSFLGVINAPDVVGTSCNYVENGLDLDPGFMGVNAALSLPSFMQSYLKIGVTCATTTGIDENTEIAINPVFPNPSANEFTIDLSNNQSEVVVYDYMGKLIEEETTNSVFHFGKEYAKGIYFVNVISGQKSNTYKVVKQ